MGVVKRASDAISDTISHVVDVAVDTVSDVASDPVKLATVAAVILAPELLPALAETEGAALAIDAATAAEGWGGAGAIGVGGEAGLAGYVPAATTVAATEALPNLGATDASLGAAGEAAVTPPDIFTDTTAIDEYLYNLEPGAGYDTTTMPTEQDVLEIMGTPDVPYEYSGNPMDATPPPEDYVPPDYTNIPAETYSPPLGTTISPTQIARILQKGLGLGGAGKIVSNLPGLLGGLSFQPTAAQTVTPFTGTYSGMNPYSPEYFQQVQQKYNTLFPSTPADVATPLQAWYNTKFVPDTSISKTLFGV